MSDKEDHFSILVVDDDEANRESLRRRLERRGYSLVVAASGEEALECMRVGHFDLLILDIMMPGMNGLEVLDRVRREHAPMILPIVMATAMDESADIVHALERGANDYVTKPLDFAVVQARVRTQLQLKRSFDRIRELERDLQVRNSELESANTQLTNSAARTQVELYAAAHVQRAFLPHTEVRMPGVRFNWLFEPCTELAGDALNVIRLDNDHAVFFVLDVSGHGVAASLLAVAATRMLSLNGSEDTMLQSRRSDGILAPTPPADIAKRLNSQFKFDFDSGRFLTMFYGLLDLRTRELTYVSAGHPGPILIDRNGCTSILHGQGAVIGFGDTYEQQTITLNDGDRLYVYSDGVTENFSADKSLFGLDRLLRTIELGIPDPLDKSLVRILETLSAWRGSAPPSDDISMVALECAGVQSE